jgi:hypothetical protein
MEAKPDPERRNQNAFLMDRCLAAARQWTFRPASLNGRPILSDYRIEFDFTPQTR